MNNIKSIIGNRRSELLSQWYGENYLNGACLL